MEIEMSIDVDNMETGEISDSDKLWALLGYIFGLIAILSLVMEDKKDNAFIRYHAIHALMFAALIVITSFTVCLWIIPWGYGVYVGFQAYQGELVEVPMLTDFAKKQGWLG